LAYIQQMRSSASPAASKTSGFTAIGIFLFFGAAMASLAAITLLWRGTPLDRVWSLNPTAYAQLTPLGRIVGILFLALSAVLITAGIGWFRRRLWGWRLAVAIIGAQALGDVVNCVRGEWLRGGNGSRHCRCFTSVSFAAESQRRVWLEFLPKRFKKQTRAYCPAVLSSLLAILTPLKPSTYLAMPR